MIIGFTNGCFDLFHDGHKHLLHEARLRCEQLYVAVNSDASVRRLKGEGRPTDNLAQRLHRVRSYIAATCLVFDDDRGLEAMIRDIAPTFIFKGEEYAGRRVVGSGCLSAWKPMVVLIPMLPGISTTKLIKERG